MIEKLFSASAGRCLVAGLASLVLAAPARTQALPESLRPGERVRIEIGPTGPHYTGRFLGLDRDSLTLQLHGHPGPIVRVPWTLVSRAWVSAGRSRNPLPGMAIGLGLGLVTGVAVGAVAAHEHGSCQDLCVLAIPIGAMEGSVAGFVIGGVIRVAVGHERWERLELPARVGAMPAGRGRVGLGFRLAW